MARLVFPRWIDERYRWGLGVEFTCPHCSERLRIYFDNPCDGLRAKAPIGAQLYHRDGTGLGAISVWPEISVGDHGCFEICRGEILYRLH